MHRKGICSTAIFPRSIESPSDRGIRVATLRLIQDGVSHGYIKHEHPDMSKVKKLTPDEHELISGLSAGMWEGEIAAATRQSIKSVRAQLKTIYTRLGLLERQNKYHAVARFTYLNSIGFFDMND